MKNSSQSSHQRVYEPINIYVEPLEDSFDDRMEIPEEIQSAKKFLNADLGQLVKKWLGSKRKSLDSMDGDEDMELLRMDSHKRSPYEDEQATRLFRTRDLYRKYWMSQGG